MCSPITGIEHGNIELHDGDGTEFSSIYFFSCDEGYQINGAPRLFCTPDGEWTADVPTCISKYPFIQQIAFVANKLITDVRSQNSLMPKNTVGWL